MLWLSVVPSESMRKKTVFKFRDAQARAGDAVTEVCVKPTVVEVKILEDKGRIKDEWTLSKEEVEIAMKGELDNIRAWGDVSVHHQIQLRCHHGSHFQSGR